MKIKAAAALLVLIACSKPQEPEVTAPPPPAASAAPVPTTNAAAAPSSTTTSRSTTAPDLAWDVPAKWHLVPSPSAMRKATYVIPKTGADAEDAEMSVSQAGGAVASNIDRWAGQFGGTKDVKKTTTKVGAFDVTVVELKGTFAGGGMPGAPPSGPKEHWALLGAIVEGVDPPYFFKLTGPEKTVLAARPDFDKLVGSLRAK